MEPTTMIALGQMVGKSYGHAIDNQFKNDKGYHDSDFTAYASGLASTGNPFGGIAQAIGNSKFRKRMQKQEAEEFQNKQKTEALTYYSRLADNDYTFFGAMGGQMPHMGKAELEKDEVYYGGNVQGDVKGRAGYGEVQGKPHEQGGTTAMATGGTRVLSNRIINPITGNSYAADAKKVIKGVDKIRKVEEKHGDDFITRNTATMYAKRLNDLFMGQEAYKQLKTTEYGN